MSDEELSQEDLDKEIKRTKAINSIASNIVETANVSLQAMKFMESQGYGITPDDGTVLGIKQKMD